MGKSCLLLRFADDTYTESYISTIGVDFVSAGGWLDGERRLGYCLLFIPHDRSRGLKCLSARCLFASGKWIMRRCVCSENSGARQISNLRMPFFSNQMNTENPHH